MGVSTAPAIAARLIVAGRSGATPALIVADASLPTERRITTTLAGLASAAAEVEGAALLIVGEAMALASSLPLVGRDSDAQPRRVGVSEVAPISPVIVDASDSPTLTAARSFPPHRGGGRVR